MYQFILQRGVFISPRGPIGKAPLDLQFDINAERQTVITDICGKGGATNHYLNNKRFHDLVVANRLDYVAARYDLKTVITRRLERAIRMANLPGHLCKKEKQRSTQTCPQALIVKGLENKQSRKERSARDEDQDVFHPDPPVIALVTTVTHTKRSWKSSCISS